MINKQQIQINQVNESDKYKQEYLKTLKLANSLYNKGAKSTSLYNYKIGLADFFEAKQYTLSVYDYLKNDKKIKDQMDFFLKAVDNQILNTEKNMKNQFTLNNYSPYNNQDGIDFKDELKKVFEKNETKNSTVLIQKKPEKKENKDNKESSIS